MAYLVSVTRLRIRSFRFVPPFFLHALRSRRQASRAPGFVCGSLLPDPKRVFWTMTVWDDLDSMRTYMSTGAHRAAMPKLLEWCDEASVVHWEQPGCVPPSWSDAERRMRADGRPSKVRRPSAAHESLQFAPLRRPAGAPIGPAKRGARPPPPPLPVPPPAPD